MRGCLQIAGTSPAQFYTPIHDTNDPTPETVYNELYYRFGSAHPTSMQGVFVDGSVRTIHFNVNDIIFMHACVRNDGQEYSPDDL